MYGAIIGDIAGSRFEFDRPGWTKDFEFITKDDEITDDTVMTAAIAQALLAAGEDADVDTIKAHCIEKMQFFGRKYPAAGYGTSFIRWLRDKDPKPYGSWGNGSAMRVSPAGWIYQDAERTLEAARATAEVSHNHPEGIKGAECTALMIYMGRTGSDLKEMQEEAISGFGYDLSESLDDMRKRHEHNESCQDTLPKALKAFFESESFEDAVRNAISLGGDTDTIAAITGAMAEAYYGIPDEIIDKVQNYIPDDIKMVITKFYESVKQNERH